jgi:hypothetical protein
VTPQAESKQSEQWNRWYRLARVALGYEHAEAAEYANLRFVEEQNRDTLRGAKRDDTLAVTRAA